MRWVALGVDYEMAVQGDLIDLVKLSGQDLRARSAARRRKASITNSSSTSTARKFPSRKATGSPSTSGCATRHRNRCRCSCIASPRRAKRLHFDVIPRNVDDYQQFLDGFCAAGCEATELANPVWHIHAGHLPAADLPVTFQLLLTLVSSSNAENAATQWGFHRALSSGCDAADPPGSSTPWSATPSTTIATSWRLDEDVPRAERRPERVALQDLRDALS